MCVCLVAQLCPTLCDPLDCSPPDSSVHGILQARILEWVAIPFSRGIFPTQGSNPGLLHCREILYHLRQPKETKPVNPKGNQPWISIGRTDTEAEAPILWPSDAKRWLTGKDPDAEKDSGQQKGATEEEMVGWHHQLNGHECEQTLGDSEGQGSLACCSPWACKELDTT